MLSIYDQGKISSKLTTILYLKSFVSKSFACPTPAQPLPNPPSALVCTFALSAQPPSGRGNSLQGPLGPVNKLGAWCRSSPGGGTNFQNPNFEISSILALLACLRRFGTLKKNVIPDFSSILALLACLRRFGTLKKRPSPKNYRKRQKNMDTCQIFGGWPFFEGSEAPQARQ